MQEHKLEYYHEGQSEKQLRDISGILAIYSEQIDFKILDEKIKERLAAKAWSTAIEFKI
jgi:hypothetical protein